MQGIEITKQHFDYVFNFAENYGIVELDGKFGFVDNNGEISSWSIERAATSSEFDV